MKRKERERERDEKAERKTSRVKKRKEGYENTKIKI